MTTKIVKIKTDTSSHSTYSDYRTSLHGFELHRVRKVTLISAVVRNDQYNINENNNTLNILLDGIPSTIVLPVGQYNINTLIAALELANPNWDLEQDQLTFLIKITALVGDFQILTTGTLQNYIGFPEGTPPAGTLEVASTLANLNGLDVIYIHSNALAPNRSISNGVGSDGEGNTSSNIFGVIPITSSYGAFTSFHDMGVSEGSTITYQQPKDISNFTVELRDENDDLCILNHPVYLTFKVYF